MADKLPVEQNSPWSSQSPEPQPAPARTPHVPTLQPTARWRAISRQLAPRPAAGTAEVGTAVPPSPTPAPGGTRSPDPGTAEQPAASDADPFFAPGTARWPSASKTAALPVAPENAARPITPETAAHSIAPETAARPATESTAPTRTPESAGRPVARETAAPSIAPETAEAPIAAADGRSAENPEPVTTRWTDVVEIALTHRPGRGEVVAAGLVVAVLLVISCVLLSRPSSHPQPAPAAAIQVNRGFTLGRVKANDGTKLQVQDALGAVSTIHTTADTEVLVLLATRVPDIPAGALIMVHGDREPDGSITANLIMGVGTDSGGK
ncbi:hypothetical protein [Nocardia aurantia]|nr:hypothetical protein [Nocardia aurantia]